MSEIKPASTTVAVPMGYNDTAAFHGSPPASCEAIASMVCGIIGLVMFGIILGPIAIILGLLAKKKMEREPELYGGQCQATAGIIMGSIAIVLFITLILFAFS